MTALAYSPSGQVLVSGRARTLELRGGDDGAVRKVLGVGLSKVGSVAFGAGGRWLAAVGGVPGENGRVVLCDGGLERVRAETGAGTDMAMSVAWDATGQRLVVGGADRTIRVWRVVGVGEGGVGLEDERRLEGHTGPVLAVAFAPDGRRVISASADRTLGVWALEGGRRERSLGMHTDAVRALALRPGASAVDGRWECASAGDDRTVRVWQPGIGRMVRIIRGHAGPVLAVGYSPDGESLYSLGREGVLRCFEAGSDVLRWEVRVSSDWGFGLAVDPVGGRVATGDALGRVRVGRAGGQLDAVVGR